MSDKTSQGIRDFFRCPGWRKGKESIMQWTDVINDPCLRNLPFKIELNRWGNIEMIPASNKHGIFQSRLSVLLSKYMPAGEVISECSVQTPEGVKAPDVAWCSAGFLQRHGFETPYREAPELCVEILSPSNSQWEMLEKTRYIWLLARLRRGS